MRKKQFLLTLEIFELKIPLNSDMVHTHTVYGIFEKAKMKKKRGDSHIGILEIVLVTWQCLRPTIHASG